MDYSSFRHITNDRVARHEFSQRFGNADNFNERSRLSPDVSSKYAERLQTEFNKLPTQRKQFKLKKNITHPYQFRKVIAKAKINNARTSDLANIVSNYEAQKKRCACPSTRHFTGDDIVHCHCAHYRL
jgi:hypothetical protein